MKDEKQRIQSALEVAERFGGGEEDHHNAWVIDQMVRALNGDNYDQWVASVKSGEDGESTYSWSTGIAP